MPWWVLELIRFAVMIGGAILVQQLIRRHGRIYTDEIFRATPRAGPAFVALADIAYYLIVVAYTLFALNLEQSGDASNSQLQNVATSVGGLALLIGILHGLNILVLPGIGRMIARQPAAPAKPSRSRASGARKTAAQASSSERR